MFCLCESSMLILIMDFKYFGRWFLLRNALAITLNGTSSLLPKLTFCMSLYYHIMFGHAFKFGIEVYRHDSATV